MPGQGSYYSAPTGLYSAANCDDGASYGLPSLMYGLQPSPCRPCPAGMVTSRLLPNSARFWASDGGSPPRQGFTDPLACVTQAGWGYDGIKSSPCRAGYWNAAGTYSTCTACPVGLSTPNGPAGTAQVSVDNCTIAPGYGFHDGVVRLCPKGARAAAHTRLPRGARGAWPTPSACLPARLPRLPSCLSGTYNSVLRPDRVTPCTWVSRARARARAHLGRGARPARLVTPRRTLTCPAPAPACAAARTRRPCPTGLTTSQDGGSALRSCDTCLAGFGGTDCATQCGGSSGANYAPAGQAKGTDCLPCPLLEVGWAFDYKGSEQTFLPNIIARPRADSRSACLAEFLQNAEPAFYMGGSAALTPVANATTFAECAESCRAAPACQYLTYDYESRTCELKLSVSGG